MMTRRRNERPDPPLVKASFSTTESIQAEERGKASFLCFSIWTFILLARPQDHLLFLVPLRPVFLISIVTLVTIFFQRFHLSKGILQLKQVQLVILLYVIMLLGIPFAVHKRVAFNFVFMIFPRTLVYFFVFLALVKSPKRLHAIIRIAFLSAGFTSLFYLKTVFLESGYRIDASGMYDPNDIAMFLVTFLPIAFYFTVAGKKNVKKVLSCLTGLSMTVGILKTLSRGGAIALAFVVASLVFFRTPGWRGTTKSLTIIAIFGLCLYYQDTVGQRFENLESDYNLTAEGGRLHIWRQSHALFWENPLFGVGANCSQIALGFYRASQDGYQAWQVTHSSLIQVAVETGIPGLIVFLLLNVGAILNLRRIRKTSENELCLLAFYVEISFYGFWVSALFLTHGYSIILYFLLAFSAAMRLINKKADMNQALCIESGEHED